MWAAIAVLGFASVAGLAGYGLFQQGSYVQEAHEKAADYAEYTEEQYKQACIRSPAPARAQCLRDARIESELKKRDNRRDYDDLVAQRRSALWTFIMGLAALIGMALSAVGIFLVKQTFDETRRTNRIAMRENARATKRAIISVDDAKAALAIADRNAEAAARQVAIAQDTAQRQLRAYLSVSRLEMEKLTPEAGVATLILPIQNTGPTPVKTWHFRWCWTVTDELPSSEFFDKKLEPYTTPEPTLEYSFGPEQMKPIHVEIHISAEHRQAVLTRAKRLYFLGCIEYIDTFDKSHRTEFFYAYNVEGETRFGQVSIRNIMT